MPPQITQVAHTILNVDDNEDARSSLTAILQFHGFKVWEAATGGEALELVRHKPDLVLLDVVLPDQNGMTVCRRIKHDAETALTPVLLLSGLAVSGDDQVEGLTGGADAYLTKPVLPEVLVAQAKALIRVRKAEEAMHASEARLRAIFENSFDALLLIQADGTISESSPSCARVIGYSKEALIGCDAFELIHPDDQSAIQHEFYRQLRIPNSTVSAVCRIKHQDGSWRWAEMRRTNMLHDPNVSALVTNFRDITDQRAAEEQLRQAQKMEAVGRLAGGIAHDFNNLLTVINGYGELATNSLPAGHPSRELLGEMTKAGERAANLTQQLLAYSRKTVLAPKLIDVNAIISDMERLLRRLISEDIEFIARLQPNMGLIHADPGHLEQVIVNLVVNARDAMPGGGTLTIETQQVHLDSTQLESNPGVRPGEFAMISVNDTGYGMTPEVLAHLFEPFFTTKEVGKGTGLGLAAVHGIVKQSGGHLTVDSAPGAGATFRIYFPLAETIASTTQAEGGIRSAPKGTETVMLVEDESAVRSLARHVLRGCGYIVLDAAEGRAALELAERREQPIQLLITDVVMPEIGGREVAERLSAIHPETRVLYMSGYTEDAVMRHGILEEQVNFLQKPFSPLELARKVRQVLDQTSSVAATG